MPKSAAAHSTFFGISPRGMPAALRGKAMFLNTDMCG